jgi:hypothetical protein
VGNKRGYGKTYLYVTGEHTVDIFDVFFHFLRMRIFDFFHVGAKNQDRSEGGDGTTGHTSQDAKPRVKPRVNPPRV